MSPAKNDSLNRRLIDRLVAKPQHGSRLGLLGTTFELDAEFLETDWLPTLLELGAWDDRGWSSRIALEKTLLEMKGLVLLTDARRYRGRPQSLRVAVAPVDPGRGSKLHAKTLFVVNERSVRLFVGSSNLTENGYRKNREVVAVIEANQRSPLQSALIREALRGFREEFADALNDSKDEILRMAEELVGGWSEAANPAADDWFLWTYGTSRLWSEFVSRWPRGEAANRITIVSPFWSVDAAPGPVGLFLDALARADALSPLGMELRLLTECGIEPNGSHVPSFGAGLPHVPTSLPGLRAWACAVDPFVGKEDVDIEGFAAKRSLHAKVVLLEGPVTSLAYMGSANFSVRGWGFGSGPANIEAGLVLRRTGRQREALAALVPGTIGEPVPVVGNWTDGVRVEALPPDVLLWPSFVRSIQLAPSKESSEALDLIVAVEPSKIGGESSVHLVGAPADSGCLLRLDQAPDHVQYVVPVSAETLERLLRDKEVLVRWWECAEGRQYPLNVTLAARDTLPIAPGSTRPGEALLLEYYQGRISFEEMFPPPPGVWETGAGADQEAPPSGVDTSDIQSYRIREFVEALPGIVADLRGALKSTGTMRLALMGPVSPLALAREVHRAVRDNQRTAVAGGFQLVEILGCLHRIGDSDLTGKQADEWREALARTAEQVDVLLADLKQGRPYDLGPATAFARYEKALRRAWARSEQAA